MTPSVIFVREWEQQMSSSGCCGRLQGDLLGTGKNRVFVERRRIMEAMGPLYQTIKTRFGPKVDVTVIDPRNLVSLIPRLIGDFFRYRVSPSQAFATLSGVSTQTVIVNGRIYARGAWPNPNVLVADLMRLSRRSA